MSPITVLEHPLAQSVNVSLNLSFIDGLELKKIARFWFGTTAANKMRKDECIGALAKLFKDKARIQAKMDSLTDKQRQILGIFKRYGGAVSGTVLLCEVQARGLVEKTRQPHDWYEQRRHDPVIDLCDKLLLVSQDGEASHLNYHFRSSYRRIYPDLVAAPGALERIEPAAPLTWKTPSPSKPPEAGYRRFLAEVALDLMTVARALKQIDGWKTSRGGSLGKSLQNRLKKMFPWDKQDPINPPAPESLYYEILRGLGAIHVEYQFDRGTVNLQALERHLCEPGVKQAWHWVRSWMQARLWQDGIGVVPERDSYMKSVRITPEKLAGARALLVWVLGRVAQGQAGWLDLETFLTDLWDELGEEVDFYWHSYSWSPRFKSSADKNELTGAARSRAFWLDDEGIWAANAVMGTLTHLGLVERGEAEKGRPCFRLTEVGRAVFGAPEHGMTPTHDPHFLTVQPNHEVLAYLDRADAGAVGPLARFARRLSEAGGRVQTFSLTRDSIYEALEGGMELASILKFLQEHSKTGLPDNVAHSLSEWGRKRETLVICEGVTLGAAPAGRVDAVPGAAKGRRVGEQFVLLPTSSVRGGRECYAWDHRGPAPDRPWKVDAEGLIRFVKEPDALALARLAQFAEPAEGGWKITAGSVQKARERGLLADQILAWLAEHLVNELPALVEMLIRNWSSGVRSVFLGKRLLLQVHEPRARTALGASERFQQCVVAHIPPDWFIIHDDKKAELDRLLRELGFSLSDSFKQGELVKGPIAGNKQGSRRKGRPRSTKQDW